MENKEYQEEASKTIPDNNSYQDRDYSIAEKKVLNALLGLSGEVGEVTDLFKKSFFQGHPLELKEIIKEIGDVFWYMNLLCKAINIDFSTVMEMNIEKLRKRYGEHFDSNKSINREEYKK